MPKRSSPDADAGVEQTLDVVEVVGVTGVCDLDLLPRDTLLEGHLALARCGVRGRARVGHVCRESMSRMVSDAATGSGGRDG